MKPEFIALIGVITSSVISGTVAFLVAAWKAKSEFNVLERQLLLETEKQRREIAREHSNSKIDIAYKYAELTLNSRELADTFLNEISKQTAIGFLYLNDKNSKEKIWVRNNANILIGRAPMCDIILPDGLVSRQHCVIHTKDDEAYIIPLNPTNPIQVGKKDIINVVQIKKGTHIKIHPYEFIYYEL